MGRFGSEPALVIEVLVELAQRLYENSTDLPAERRVLVRAAAMAKDARLPLQYALAECTRAYTLVYDDQLDSARIAIDQARAELVRQGAGADDMVESTASPRRVSGSSRAACPTPRSCRSNAPSFWHRAWSAEASSAG